ncbi:hypothetical protein ACFFX0_11970 [Citricoccus parietis]|uniref:Uncharacterized protein n=1 Tax=Citricoccus parietis TaxID=592307 RepID=A0ABV5FYX4_9MICC
MARPPRISWATVEPRLVIMKNRSRAFFGPGVSTEFTVSSVAGAEGDSGEGMGDMLAATGWCRGGRGGPGAGLVREITGDGVAGRTSRKGHGPTDCHQYCWQSCPDAPTIQARRGCDLDHPPPA